MPPTHTIRLLTPADAHVYTLLRREMLADSPWAFIRSPEDDPGCNEPHMAISLAKKEGFAVAGAFADGAGLVGAVGVRREEHLKAAHRAHIWGVYISPAHRAKGLARNLMTAAIDAARSWPATPPLPPIDSIGLSVAERSTTAHALYLAMGFVAWGTEPDAVRIPGHPRGYAETSMLLRL